MADKYGAAATIETVFVQICRQTLAQVEKRKGETVTSAIGYWFSGKAVY